MGSSTADAVVVGGLCWRPSVLGSEGLLFLFPLAHSQPDLAPATCFVGPTVAGFSGVNLDREKSLVGMSDHDGD